MKLRGHEKYLYKQVGKAEREFGMINEADKVLVCLSGGKDSYALYRILKLRQQNLPIDFELLPMIVDCGFKKEDIEWLKNDVAKLGDTLIVELLVYDQKPENCFVCSWFRRKIFFEKSRELGCKKIALGHHFDDIVQTVLMNMFMHGKIGSMCPTMKFFGGAIEMIRPLSYVSEEQIVVYCEQLKYKALVYDCSLNGTTKRADTKNLLKKIEEEFSGHNVKMNIFNALRSENIRKEYLHDKDKPIDFKIHKP